MSSNDRTAVPTTVKVVTPFASVTAAVGALLIGAGVLGFLTLVAQLVAGEELAGVPAIISLFMSGVYALWMSVADMVEKVQENTAIIMRELAQNNRTT